jgi:hypothetical protein
MVGRPSGDPLDLEIPGPVAQDVVEVDQRGRVLLSPRIVADIGWLSKLEKGEVQSLAVLDRPMTVRLLSFEVYGNVVLARRRELIRVIDQDPDALETLVLLEDRYHRIKIPHDRRLTLSSVLAAHLEVKPGESIVYVERLRDEVRLLSPRIRSQRVLSTIEQLAGLP